MAVTPIPYSSNYQSFGPSPKIGRFAVSLKGEVSIKDIALANHTGLTGASNTPTGVLYEGSIVQKGSDGNWYWYGVTLPGGVTVDFITGATPAPQLAVLVDSYDTNINGGTPPANPVNAQAYISGAFMYDWLLMGGASPAAVSTIEKYLRLNNIIYEGTSSVGATYGPVIPREDAPV
jgi:hypothetical protein